MAPSLKFCLKLAVSGGLILYLALTLNWGSIGRAMQGMRAGFYWLSVAVTLLSTCFMAWKCVLLIERSPIRCSFWELVKINIMARFYALFLPPALGPEMVRWYKITREGPGKTFFMAGTLFERAGFVLVSLVVSALFLFLSPFSGEIAALRDRMLPLLAVMVIGTLLVQGFFSLKGAS
jgi:glycosyltransferase 2 family protein